MSGLTRFDRWKFEAVDGGDKCDDNDERLNYCVKNIEDKLV